MKHDFNSSIISYCEIQVPPYIPYNEIHAACSFFSFVRNDKQFINVSYAVIINMTLLISVSTLGSYHQGSV